MQRLLEEDKNVTIIEDLVEDLIVDNNKIVGVKLSTGKEIYSEICNFNNWNLYEGRYISR